MIANSSIGMRRDHPRHRTGNWIAYEKQNRSLQKATTDVLTTAGRLRKGTTNRIMAKSDLELGLVALAGSHRNSTRNIGCNALPRT